ncbi:hypothetical protein GWG65_18740 [Bradyrhizobium sp. CSA207]|uniref:hypothetical protein n=1 Tax=Bradyrhizobium sp. CSA207 TaxID=2698826 RepID=UPI0023B1BDCE|nr:hypothetical protein [Bradyrhizobium sp. CSA207]MDE5443446.1 hypothetical protein [Bradyrhizobium sp. CSA207]
MNALVIGLMLGIIRFALLAVAVGLLAIVCRTCGKRGAILRGDGEPAMMNVL